MTISAKKIGLYFGSFNPIHIGHLIIANHFLTFTDLDQLWFVVSPHSPFKQKKSLLKDHHRLNMVKIAIDDHPDFRASDIEFKLPQPSFTIHTLTALQEEYSDKEFFLVMGSDNLRSFKKWKNYEQIIQNHKILVYPRPGDLDNELSNHPQVKMVEAPLMEISSSFIRSCIAQNISVKYYLKPEVLEYIDEMNFYRL